MQVDTYNNPLLSYPTTRQITFAPLGFSVYKPMDLYDW